MKKNKTKNRSKSPSALAESTSKLDTYIWRIFLIMLVVIPLTVKMHPTDHINPIVGSNFLSTAFTMDLFSFYKYVFLIIGTGFLIIFFLTKMLSKGYTIKQDKINIPLLVFITLILLSAIFAEYKHFALIGIYNRYEATIAFLSYASIFLIAANINYTEKKITYLIRALYPLAIVNAVLGLLWFYGINIMEIEFIRNFLTSSALSDDAVVGHILATFPNPNYVSGIGAVLCLMFLTKAIFDKNIIERVINLFFSILSFIMVLTSLSTSGFVTIVFLIPLLLAFIFKSNVRKNALITLAITLIIFSGILSILNTHNERVWDESLGFFTGAIQKALPMEENKSEPVQEEQAPEEPAQETRVEEKALVDVATEFNLPEKLESFGTGRGYIWKETLKLIKEKPILGHGFATFTFYFPQNDPNRGGTEETVDKPHNFYLDLAYSSGIFALIAFLALIIINLYRHYKIYLTGINTNSKYLMVVLFMGWSAFLMQWLFNDTRIGTTFIFWIIFGVSISLLRQLYQESFE